MKLTETFDKSNVDHLDFLKQELKKIGNFSEQETVELSEAMQFHSVNLISLVRAMRNYVQNPFGKYFYLGEKNGSR